MKYLIALWNWLFSVRINERKKKSPTEKLQMSMRVTAKCRYNAATRLQRRGRFEFFTTTSLSLGLIFIPLMQNSGIPLAFEANVLNMMQIFLAVAVLVYSVVIGTARYELRAEKLTECGDKLKDLIRAIDKEKSGADLGTDRLSAFNERYSDIVTDSENHIRSDYKLAMHEMVNDYCMTGLPKFWNLLSAYSNRSFSYIIPMMMIAFELVFIADMIAVTEILAPYLNGYHVSGLS